MPTIAHSRIPLPQSPEEFEDITLSAARSRWNSPDFFKNGRRGQGQQSVDIFATLEGGQRIGIQCKHTPGGLTFSTVEKEVAKAEAFTPQLTILYIATSAPTDAVLQKNVRVLSEMRRSAGRFTVELLFWDALVSDLVRDEGAFFKHYPQFAPRHMESDVSVEQESSCFQIDQLAVTRQAALGGRSVSIQHLQAFGCVLGAFGLISVLLTIVAKVDIGMRWWTSPLMMFSLPFGMMVIVVPQVLKKRKFEHLCLRRYFVEASRNDRLHVNQLSATCPWCTSQMRLLNVGPKDGPRDDVFVCERVPRQHRILLDPSLLPELEG